MKLWCHLLGFCSVLQAAEPARLNRTIELLEAGKPVFGIFSGNHSPANARALAVTDLDHTLIDMEHHPFDAERLRIMLLGMTDKQALIRKGNLQPHVTPFVRIPQNGRENLQFMVKQVLDVGAFGVMFPYVETAEEARAAVAAMRYPQRSDTAPGERQPEGLRGFGTANGSWYWGLSVPEYVQRADVWPLDPKGELLAIIQIETPRGASNIDSILAVPGIGVIYIGPNDMAQSVGAGNNMEAPEVEEEIQKVLKACLARKMPCGIIAFTPPLAAKRLAQGFTFITVGIDGGMTPIADATLKVVREAAKR